MNVEIAGSVGRETGGRRKPRRLSQLFINLSSQAQGAVSIGTIRDALGNRSFAALLVLFALINLIPSPPGTSAVLGLPLLIISAQMILGSKRVWLPRLLVDRTIPAETFRSIMGRVIPWLVRVEQLIRPRYWPFWRRRGDRVIGIIALIMAVSITLPIPLGNWLPALSTFLLGLALSERDGLLFAIATIVGIVAIALVVLVIGAAGMVANAFFGWLL